MKSINSIVILTLVILIIACQEKAMNPEIPSGPDFSVTPMENEEAEEAAYFLAKSIIAPLPLYDRIKNELAFIRSAWSDSIEHVQIKFRIPNVPSTLIIWVNPTTYDSMRAGDYHEWDSLNAYYRLDSVTYRWRHEDHAEIIMRFHGRLNSQILLYSYSGMPGFQFITLGSTRVGGGPDLYIYKSGAQLKYFFVNAYDDCPSGCLSAEFYYFLVDRKEAKLIDSYFLIYPDYDDFPRPSWMDTIVLVRQEYYEVDSWYSDDFVL